MADIQKTSQAISKVQTDSYQEAADKLFEAMDIITSKRVSSVGFDKTIVCTIESATNSKNGMYKVTDGTSHFNAYADTTAKYSEGQKVYVKIPGGDMNNQKLITGKYIASTEEYITYVSALDSFVEVTGNVIENSDSQFSLKANGNISSKVIWEFNGERVKSATSQADVIKNIKDTLAIETEAILADENIGDKAAAVKELQDYAYDRISNLTSDTKYEEIIQAIRDSKVLDPTKKEQMIEDLNGITSYSGYKGYTRIGLSGSFKTSALDLRTTKGAFGLRLDVLGVTSTGLTEFRRFYLDASEMFGNPYRYITFSKQEMMFDISMYAEIAQARLIFYQNNDFILDDGSKLDPKAFNVDDIILQSPYVAFGFDMESFTEDAIIIGSPDSLMYSSENAPPNKDIYMRWVHENNGKFYAIDEIEEVPEQATIHWYRYKLEVGRNDPLAGEFWAEIKEDPILGKDLFNYNFVPNFEADTDAFKVIIEIPSRKIITQELGKNISLLQKLGELQAANPSQGLIDGIQSMLNETDMKKLSEDYTKYSGLYILEDDSTSLGLFEEIYNIIVEERSKTKFYESKQLVFTNAIPQSTESIDLIQGLSVVIDEENYEGIYRLYDDTYNIINSTEASKLRTLKAEYSSIATGIDVLDSAEEIAWYFPISNTMIHKPELGKEYTEEDTYVENCEKNGYVKIVRAGVDSVEKQEPGVKLIETTQKFRIKDRYVQAASNNAIYCTVKKRGRIYEAYVLPTFGVAGSNGTDATFLLKMYEYNNGEPGREVSALTANSKIIVVPELYDFNNQPIVITSSNKVEYKWKDKIVHEEDKIKYEVLDNNYLLITSSSELLEDMMCYTLQAEVPYSIIMNKEESVEGEETESRKVKLSAYLPIAVRSDVKYVELEGATWVVYENTGVNPKYYKMPYKLYGDNLIAYNDIYWEGYSPEFPEDEDEEQENSVKKYYPVVSLNGEFKPPKMFYQGCDDFCVNAYDGEGNLVWTQPVLISQNRYGSPMLNDWDGDLTIDEKNGTILSAMMGAGVKNDDNSFSGVLMGQIGKAFNNDNIGLYGYDHGAQSFSFDVSGTATLGVSGKGQIKFDGNEGTIKSGNYSKENKTGMLIDLDESIMTAYGQAGSFEMDMSNSSTALLKIKGFNTDNSELKTMLNVEQGNYYLQSVDFSDNDKLGLKFNLSTGKIKAYSFELKTFDVESGAEIEIDSTGSPYFRINSGYGYRDEDGNYVTYRMIPLIKTSAGQKPYEPNKYYIDSGEQTGFVKVVDYNAYITYYSAEDLNSKLEKVYDNSTTRSFEEAKNNSDNPLYIIDENNYFLDNSNTYISSIDYYIKSNNTYQKVTVYNNETYKSFQISKNEGILYYTNKEPIKDTLGSYSSELNYLKKNNDNTYSSVQIYPRDDTIYVKYEINKFYVKLSEDNFQLSTEYKTYQTYYTRTSSVSEETGETIHIYTKEERIVISPEAEFYTPNTYYYTDTNWKLVQSNESYSEDKNYALLLEEEINSTSYIVVDSEYIYANNTYYIISDTVIYKRITSSDTYNNNLQYYIKENEEYYPVDVIEKETATIKIFVSNAFWRYYDGEARILSVDYDYNSSLTYYETKEATSPISLYDNFYTAYEAQKYYIYVTSTDTYQLDPYGEFKEDITYYEKIITEKPNGVDLVNITKNTFTLKSLDWKIGESGLHFSLSANSGFIEGYGQYTDGDKNIKHPKFILDWRPRSNPINVNNGVFKVKWDGEVYTSKLKAVGGDIGGWNISNSSLSSGSIYFSSSGANKGIIVGTKPENLIENASGNKGVTENNGSDTISTKVIKPEDIINNSAQYFRVDDKGNVQAYNATLANVVTNKLSTKYLYVDGVQYVQKKKGIITSLSNSLVKKEQQIKLTGVNGTGQFTIYGSWFKDSNNKQCSGSHTLYNVARTSTYTFTTYSLSSNQQKTNLYYLGPKEG
jgi:hypothetical protein